MSDPKLNLLLTADDKTAAAFNALNNRLQNVERSAKRTSDSFSSFGRVAAGVFAGVQVAGAVKSVTNLADAYKNVNARLMVVSDSTAEFKSAQDALFNISQKTRTGLQETTDLYAQLARGTKDMQLPQETMLKLTEGINKAVTLSGSSTQAANAALVQLSQGFAAGALRGQEFMSVQEQAPVILETVRKGLGLTQSELKKMAEEGKLTNDVFIKGFFAGMGDLERQFGQLPVTIAQSMLQIRNSLMKAIGTFDEATGASSAVASAFTSIAEGISAVGTAYKNNKSAFDAIFVGIASSAAIAGFSAIITKIGAITTALSGMAAVLMANPALLAVMGLAAVGMGVASYLNDKSKEMPASVQAAQQRIEKLQAELDKKRFVQTRNGIIEQNIVVGKQREAYKALIEQLKQYIEVTQQASYANAFEAGLTTDSPAAKKAAIDEKTLSARQKFINQLQSQLDSLVYSERDLVRMGAERLGVDVKQALSLFDQAQAMRDLDAASKSASDEAKKRLKDILDAGKEQDANNQRQKNVIAGFQNQMQAYKDMLAVRNSGLLLSQEEIDYQERMNQLNKAYNASKLQIEKAGGIYTLQNLEALGLEYEMMKKIIAQIKEKAVAQKNDLFGGFQSGMKIYFDDVSNFSKMTEDATVRAFQGMEDALVSFVQTGKLNFGDLARSIIADIARIYVRQSMITPLLSAIGLGGSSVPLSTPGVTYSPEAWAASSAAFSLSGKKASGGPVTGGKTYLVGEKGPELFTASSSGNITPNNQLGGGGVVVNQTINVSTGVQQTVRAEVMSLMPQIANAAKSAVADAKLRGGSYAAALR